MKLNITRYVTYRDSKDSIDAIRRSGAKVDPMWNGSTVDTIRVAEWVPKAVKMWRENDEYGGLPLEEFLRKTIGRTNQ